MSADDGAGDGGETPDVVDFNALSAALGDLPPPPISSDPIAESRGRPVATYASARPHAIPQTRLPAADEQAQPNVIVEAVSQPQLPVAAHYTPQVTPPPPAHAFTPPRAFPVQPLADPMQIFEQKPRSPTMIIRVRGPTRTQKVLVFIMVLVVFVAAGIALVMYYRPGFLARHRAPPRVTAPAPVPSAVPALTAVTPSSLPAAPTASVTAAASSSSATLPPPKKLPRR